MSDQPAQVIVYQKLQVPPNTGTNENALLEFYDQVITQLQGEPVEIEESENIPALMFAFEAIRKYCPEAVFKFVTGEQVLIFDHHLQPVIRPKDLLENVVDLSWHMDDPKIDKQIVDIESIWQETLGKDFAKRVELSVNKLKKILKYADQTVLIGKGPGILFLVAQYLLYPSSSKIVYLETKASKPIWLMKKD